MGPSCWFLPLLLIVFLWFQFANISRWNTEGTPFEGIVIEYLVGACMAATASRCQPLWTCRPAVARRRIKNLAWSRWGLEEEGGEQMALSGGNVNTRSV